MKKILLLSMIMLTLCFQGLAQSDVNSENRSVEAFTKIASDGVYSLYLMQGDKDAVVVKTAPELQKEIQVEVKKGILKISTTKELKKKDTPKIYVTFKKLSALDFNGVGKVESQTAIKGDSLDLRVDGVGNVELNLNIKYISLRVDGVGNVELEGVAEELSVKKDGVGNLDAEDLKAERVTIKNAGVGNTNVYASKELSMKNTGVGNLIYSGEAVIKQVENSGIGKIKKSK